MKLNKKDIINLLPHREPMLLIDELININKFKIATAIMYVKNDAFYVNGHFPDNPVMPGVYSRGIWPSCCCTYRSWY